MHQLQNETAEYRKLLEVIDVPVITQYIPLATIKHVVQACGVEEKRVRRLPMWLMMLVCILRGIFAKESLSSVFARLCMVPCLKTQFDLSRIPDKSALCLARYRLGARPLAMLFKQICRPIATPDTPGAYEFGRRLVAIDTTFEVVWDSEANATYFGRHRTKTERQDPAYPQCQAVYLSECSTHVVFDAAIVPMRSNHHYYCKRLLRSVKSDMLVMLDSGLLEFETLQRIVKKEAHFIIPAKADMKLTPLQTLCDGSYLAELRFWKNGYRRAQPRLLVRVIRYTLDDPVRNPDGKTYRMITSLLDPHVAPSKQVIETYHQRWEIELAIDEIDTHQRLTWTPFRSQKPVGVVQEFYALLLAYFVICCLRFESASASGESPQRFSFVNTLRLVEHILPLTQIVNSMESFQSLIHQWALYFRLPPRDNRINPRVIKRKMIKFRRKKPHDISEHVPDFGDILHLLPAP